MINSIQRALSVLSENALSQYDAIDFNDPSKIYNQRAPEPIVSFIIGGVLCVLTVVYWYLYRWSDFKTTVQDKGWSVKLRTIISTLADNDEPAFTILRVSSQSMLLLGGFQLDYQLTFAFMLGKFFASVSSLLPP